MSAPSASVDVVFESADPLALPRIDMHSFRRRRPLRRAVTGSLVPYLTVRRVGAAARRALSDDMARYLELVADARATKSGAPSKPEPALR